MADEHKKGIKKSSVLDQWRKRKKQQPTVNPLVRRVEGAKPIVSNGQRRLWLLQTLHPKSPYYQYGHLYKIKGKLDLSLLKESFQILINRHEALRSNFSQKEGELNGTIRNEVIFNFEGIVKAHAEDENLQTEIDQFTKRTFDLANDLLLRVKVFVLGPEENWLLLSMHHIIGDRTSLLVMNQELFSIYTELKNGNTPSLPDLSIQYPDYAYWQSKIETPKEQLDYWINKLAGDLPILKLPGVKNRAVKSSFSGSNEKYFLSEEISTKVKELAKAEATTPYVVLLSIFKILLYRYSGQSDIIIGSPFSIRDKSALENLIGFFNETLVLRTQLSAEQSLKEVINQVKKNTIEAFENRQVSFDQLVKKVAPKRYGNTNPIFQVMFLYNTKSEILTAPEISDIQEEVLDLGVSKFDLTLFATDLGKQLLLVIEYANDLFEPSSIRSLLQHFEQLLESGIKEANRPIAQLRLVTKQEEQKLLVKNEKQVTIPEVNAIHHLISRHAKSSPEQSAVVYQNEQISYAELDRQANLIAQRLLKNDVQLNTPVGLYTNKGIATFTAMLGILKAGAAYLPLDPAYPAERIRFMIEDSGAKMVLCQETTKTQLEDISVETLVIESIITEEQLAEDFILPQVDKENLAYIIYTSGSTGNPKGVPINHENLICSTTARYTFYPENPSCFLLLSSHSFDSSVAGIFWTLTTGGTLLIPKKRIEQDIDTLGKLIDQHKVSHSLMLPSLYQTILQYVDANKLQSLRNIMVAGEACPFNLINQHYQTLPDTKLYNEYGPTEATVWCIAHEIKPDEKGFVPIGKAIPNYEVFILDKGLQLTPIGVVGELYIGGPGLSTGYLNRPELTQHKFIPHPFQKEENKRLYKTGDLARYHQSGLIEFLGRADQQAKIRGFRVEPREIEKVIQSFEKVDEAIVSIQIQKQENGNEQKHLVAFVTGADTRDHSGLKDFLAQQLPDYMVPKHILHLEEWPRLPNGKVNRNALPKADFSQADTSSQYKAPSSNEEKLLVEIWENTLGVKQIGIQDNFFALGGDSILSIKIIAEARKKGYKIAANHLFEFQTIEQLAPEIRPITLEQKSIDSFLSSSPNIRREATLSFLQKAFLFSHQQGENDQGQLHLDFTIKGFIDPGLFKNAWQYIFDHHAALRTVLEHNSEGKPIQVVLPSVECSIEYQDWSEEGSEKNQQRLAHFSQQIQKETINLFKAPLSKLYLIRCSAESYTLFWNCHHIILDGWSCGIILKDVLAVYQQIGSGKVIRLTSSPDFIDFLSWKEKQDSKPAQDFWQSQLADFKNKKTFFSNSQATGFENESWEISEHQSNDIFLFCKKNNISPGTFFQGIWSLILATIFQNNDIVFGLTTSGRFAPFEGITEASGLYMNVLPNRVNLEHFTSIRELLEYMQKAQGQLAAYEYYGLEEIQSWINWPMQLPIFESLFVYGNFLKEKTKIGNLEVQGFKGGFSSTYPLTIRVNPTKAIGLDLRFQQEIISFEGIQWLKKSLSKLIDDLLSAKASLTPKNLISATPATEYFKFNKENEQSVSSEQDEVNYQSPATSTQLELTKIWEQLFNKTGIGINDNYFELGGKSMMAIKLFSLIEIKFGKVFSPATLLQHPTIASIAQLLEKDEPQQQYRSLVPMRSTGNKAPLFCLHGGGAHVLFYKALTEYLPKDQPVYSLQPLGLNENEKRQESIEEMAAYYLEEIKMIQPKGPYRILGTCFSNAVALEIAHQLSNNKEELALLAIIDSGPVHLFGDAESGESRTWARFADMLKRGDFQRIRRKIFNRIRPTKSSVKAPIQETSAERNLRLTIESLNELYAKYHWKPYPGKIHFIRSSEFHARKDKNYHIQQWNKLAQGALEVHVVEGHHLTLFEEPEVKGLSKQIEECLKEETELS